MSSLAATAEKEQDKATNEGMEPFRSPELQEMLPQLKALSSRGRNQSFSSGTLRLASPVFCTRVAAQAPLFFYRGPKQKIHVTWLGFYETDAHLPDLVILNS
jgi:hypothetical protein